MTAWMRLFDFMSDPYLGSGGAQLAGLLGESMAV